MLANPRRAVTEPVAAPEAAPADTTAATAPDANSAETTNLAEAGDAENTAQIDENLDAAIAEMEALIAANPDLFVGLTVEDADEIVQQIQLELSHINKGDVPPGAAQDSSGDITDIVTGDINLASMTAQGQPNSPGQQAVNIVGASETQASPQVAAIAIGDVPVTIVTTEAPTIVVDHSQFGHARIGASFTSYVGIAARGAASSRPRCSGDAGGRYIESRTRSPIRLTRRAHRRPFHRPAPAKDDLWTMAPMTALGTIIGTAATSAVGGIGAVAAPEVK